MTFGHIRHGPQCWPGGDPPEPSDGAAGQRFRGRGLPGEVAARVREAVESSACLSLVSAPADHFTVVTTATVIGTAVTRHWPCGTAGELVTRWKAPRACPRSGTTPPECRQGRSRRRS